MNCGALEIQQREKLNYLLDRAPSDSSLDFSFQKAKETYEGFIQITSSQRKFLAKAAQSDPAALLADLFEQIKGQIAVWNAQRFSV